MKSVPLMHQQMANFTENLRIPVPEHPPHSQEVRRLAAMLEPVTIEEIDQLLSELEQLAHSTASRQRFYESALERLQFLLGAVSGQSCCERQISNGCPLHSSNWLMGDRTRTLNC
ncbi:MAG: hypothetical protein R3C53_20085 [Pirellulaceae bacterium]